MASAQFTHASEVPTHPPLMPSHQKTQECAAQGQRHGCLLGAASGDAWGCAEPPPPPPPVTLGDCEQVGLAIHSPAPVFGEGLTPPQVGRRAGAALRKPTERMDSDLRH